MCDNRILNGEHRTLEDLGSWELRILDRCAPRATDHVRRLSSKRFKTHFTLSLMCVCVCSINLSTQKSTILQLFI